MEIKLGGTMFEVNEEQKNLLKATASKDKAVAEKHSQALAQVLERAWRAGVLHPDMIDNIFDRIPLPAGGDAKFPFDFYAPADEEAERFKAFLVPQEGAIPERAIEGSEIYIPTFKIANSIDWSLDYARDARWDVIARAIEVFTNGFVQRLNDEGWHVVLACAGEHAVTTDSAAAAGTFTVNLVTSLMTAIKRLSGGRGSRVTDIYLSPEGIADIRSLSSFTVEDDANNYGFMKGPHDDLVRTLLSTPEGTAPSLFGVRMHEIQELGAPGGTAEEYQSYLTDTVGVSLPAGDEEFCVALDLASRDSFVMPVREDMQMFDDPTLHRSARAGVYGWMEQGFGCLDSRRALLGSF